VRPQQGQGASPIPAPNLGKRFQLGSIGDDRRPPATPVGDAALPVDDGLSLWRRHALLEQGQVRLYNLIEEAPRGLLACATLPEVHVPGRDAELHLSGT
jgi:hypothetical protein